jgi:hypothetical protein
MRFDFETWLTQIYGLKAKDLTEKEMALAKKEYSEEYPKVGESEIKLKTYPFQKYLNSREK